MRRGICGVIVAGALMAGLVGPAGAATANQQTAERIALGISFQAVTMANLDHAVVNASYIAEALKAGPKGVSASVSRKASNVWKFVVPTGKTKTVACVVEPSAKGANPVLYGSGAGPC